MTRLSGGCACGAVRYTSSADAKFAFHCQCRDCQFMTGSGHATQFAIDRGDIAFEGELTWWDRKNAAGSTISKGFCGTCGCPVYGVTSRFPDNLMVMVGTLDDPSAVTPGRIFFAEEAQPWDHQSVPEAGA